MIRKLAFALSLLSLMITESVLALGIGEATVKSALNQPLKAEIELVNTGELSAEEILPGLATREEFLRANVDRVYFLSDLRFKVETSEDGKLVVVLTTNKPVREPFLNFLVEVIWPSGRLLREYALLIDPPLFSDAPAAPVRASTVSSDSAQQGDTLNVPQPAAVTNRSVANPSTGVAANRISGGEYGPTDSNDTLWDIALKARPNRNVSPQQVMLAIQDLNPGAFIQGNINKLKAGQVLRLPTMEQIKQRSAHQAIEQVIAQNETVRGKRTKSVASNQKALQAPAASAPSSSVSTGDELKLVVAEQASDSASSANSGTSTAGSGSRSTSNPELAIALEKLDKANIENQELSSRMTDLEEQLQTLQRLLTLKNDQLANIQTQMRANELEKAKALQQQTDDTAPNNTLGAEPVTAPSELVDSGEQQGSDVAATEASNQVVAVDEAVNEPVSVEQAPQVTMGASTKPEASAMVAKPAAPTAGLDKKADTEQNIIEVIVGNTLYLAIAILVVIAVVVVLWLVSRNNAKREEEFQALHGDALEESYEDEDEDDVRDEDEISDDGLDGSAVEEVAEDLVDEYIDEDIFNESEALASEGEDEDIISEADVYIAYGRLDQAASVLEAAISEDPVRTDLRLKLLEVYKQSGDAEAFNRQYSELEAIQDAGAIEQANAIRGEMLDEQLVSIEDKEHELELGRELEAAEDAQREAESTLETEVEALEEPQSFNFDSVELDEEGLALDEELGDILDTELSEELGGDLGSDLGSDLDVELSDELSAELDKELDADLGDSDLASDAGLASGNDLGVDEAVNDIADELASSDDFDDSILDVDLDDIDLSGELDQETEIQLPSDLSDSALVESLAQDGESSSVDDVLASEEPVVSDEILEQAAEKLEEAQSIDEGLGDAGDFDFLEGTDEASTKLDLARAYIDMGDVEGAKDILEEVTKEGNSDQQAEATDLLKSLDS
jgi:pilus assembly protein FimV